jgi:hypothetical protein
LERGGLERGGLERGRWGEGLSVGEKVKRRWCEPADIGWAVRKGWWLVARGGRDNSDKRLAVVKADGEWSRRRAVMGDAM